MTLPATLTLRLELIVGVKVPPRGNRQRSPEWGRLGLYLLDNRFHYVSVREYTRILLKRSDHLLLDELREGLSPPRPCGQPREERRVEFNRHTRHIDPREWL